MQTHTIRWGRVGNTALAAWFVTLSVMRRRAPRGPRDRLPLYLRGTAAWLRGGDPWSVHMATLYFAAAPPSLLPMAPFALLPEPVGLAILSVVARRVGLDAAPAGPAVVVDHLAAARRQPVERQPAAVPGSVADRRRAWLAPIVKVYAIVPLIIQLRLRAASSRSRSCS